VLVDRRRLLLCGVAGVLGAACRSVGPRSEASPEPTSPVVDGWRLEAQAIIADALVALRTFEDFAAYRVSVTPSSGLRSAASLVWDPPTGVAWDAATHTSHGLHDRANQLFQAITTASIDPALWRTQRSMADATRSLLTLGDALQAYRDGVDRLPPGDASGALGVLDRAWGQWDGAAAQWGLNRSEAIACQA
jgi:hypothetical protein